MFFYKALSPLREHKRVFLNKDPFADTGIPESALPWRMDGKVLLQN